MKLELFTLHNDLLLVKKLLSNSESYSEAYKKKLYELIVEMKINFRALLDSYPSKGDISFVKHLMTDELLIDDGIRFCILEFYGTYSVKVNMLEWKNLFDEKMMVYLKDKLQTNPTKDVIGYVENIVATNKIVLSFQYSIIAQLKHWCPALILNNSIKDIIAKPEFSEEVDRS